jgi:hypothetical protein
MSTYWSILRTNLSATFQQYFYTHWTWNILIQLNISQGFTNISFQWPRLSSSVLDTIKTKTSDILSEIWQKMQCQIKQKAVAHPKQLFIQLYKTGEIQVAGSNLNDICRCFFCPHETVAVNTRQSPLPLFP